MKAVLFALALAAGGAAAAQPGNTVNDPSQASGPRGITQQGTDPNGQPCTPPGFNNGSSAYPACGGAGGMSGSGTTGTMGSTTATGSGMSPPPCSRTVTDGCIQTYERGVSRAR